MLSPSEPNMPAEGPEVGRASGSRSFGVRPGTEGLPTEVDHAAVVRVSDLLLAVVGTPVVRSMRLRRSVGPQGTHTRVRTDDLTRRKVEYGAS
jgi:hypothetical protein